MLVFLCLPLSNRDLVLVTSFPYCGSNEAFPDIVLVLSRLVCFKPFNSFVSVASSISESLTSAYVVVVVFFFFSHLNQICIMLCADHGPCVSGAHNTIVTARAGKDLVSSLVTGVLISF